MGGILIVCMCVSSLYIVKCAMSYVTAKGVMKGEEKEEEVGRRKKHKKNF